MYIHVYVYVIAQAGVIFGIYFTSCRFPFSALLQATQQGRYITFFTLVGDISRRQVIFHIGR